MVGLLFIKDFRQRCELDGMSRIGACLEEISICSLER